MLNDASYRGEPERSPETFGFDQQEIKIEESPSLSPPRRRAQDYATIATRRERSRSPSRQGNSSSRKRKYSARNYSTRRDDPSRRDYSSRRNPPNRRMNVNLNYFDTPNDNFIILSNLTEGNKTRSTKFIPL